MRASSRSCCTRWWLGGVLRPCLRVSHRTLSTFRTLHRRLILPQWVSIYMYIYIYTYTNTYIYTHKYTCIYTYKYTYECRPPSTFRALRCCSILLRWLQIYVYIYIYICIYTCVDAYTQRVTPQVLSGHFVVARSCHNEYIVAHTATHCNNEYKYMQLCNHVNMHINVQMHVIYMGIHIHKKLPHPKYIQDTWSSPNFVCLFFISIYRYLLYLSFNFYRSRLYVPVLSRQTLLDFAVVSTTDERWGGGLGSSTISKNLMSPTPRRKWYLTTGRRAH